jgi:hypothetical protein
MRLFLAGVSILTVLATSPLGISQAVADQCAPGLACNDRASPACLFNPARREWKCTPRGVVGCGSTYLTWYCPAGWNCNGDGSDPAHDCRR